MPPSLLASRHEGGSMLEVIGDMAILLIMSALIVLLILNLRRHW